MKQNKNQKEINHIKHYFFFKSIYKNELEESCNKIHIKTKVKINFLKLYSIYK